MRSSSRHVFLLSPVVPFCLLLFCEEELSGWDISDLLKFGEYIPTAMALVHCRHTKHG